MYVKEKLISGHRSVGIMERITYARLGDADAIFALLKKEGRAAYTKDIVIDTIRTKGSLCLRMVQDGILIGAVGARAEGRHSAWVYYIVIDRRFRLRGNSKKLMNMLFKACAKKGIKRIALDTPDCSYFGKFGFREVGRIKRWYEDRDQVIMYRPV